MTKQGMTIRTGNGKIEVGEWEINKVLEAFANHHQVAEIAKTYRIDERVVQHIINNADQ